MLGLFEPDSGEILIDGRPLRHLQREVYRRQIAAVMQDDHLFAGSLAENIAFFDPDLDMQRVTSCAMAAAIHDEIMATPMGYNSLVGDMGTTLSGGQKQRVLLARALYKRPRILFVDEGTSHLDTRTEHKVNDAIGRLGMTRVIIAHRPETVRMADRAIVLNNGMAHEAMAGMPDQAASYQAEDGRDQPSP
jgi:ATP-binding cassette, subfamily B, bacterial CvaB/MchF/RaxB